MSMLDASDLLDSIIAALQDIPTLLPFVNNDPANIYASYIDYAIPGTNTETSIVQQRPATIMGMWLGTRTGNFAKQEAIKHDYGLYLKPAGRPSTMFRAIREGIVTSKGLKFRLINIDPQVSLPEQFYCQPKEISIAARQQIYTFTEVTFTLTERGLDV